MDLSMALRAVGIQRRPQVGVPVNIRHSLAKVIGRRGAVPRVAPQAEERWRLPQ